MASLQELANALSGLLQAAGIGKYAVSLTESEKRELNTEQTSFSLFYCFPAPGNITDN